MVELLPCKEKTGVRFPVPAPAYGVGSSMVERELVKL